MSEITTLELELDSLEAAHNMLRGLKHLKGRSFAVTAKLICAFVFAYADCWFSHKAAHILYTPLVSNFRGLWVFCLATKTYVIG